MAVEAHMTGIAVIGYGYWGPQIARNFAALDNARLVAVCDCKEERLALARAQHPCARCVTDAAELLGDSSIDAVAIATPVSSHFTLAAAFLAAGKHVLVEKPLAASSAQARSLVSAAADNRRVLLVDHTYLYSSAVQTIDAMLMRGELGEVFYYDSVRINLGRFRSDVDVLWDLASHDLAILDYLFEDAPTSLQVAGFMHGQEEPCPLAYLTLRWGERRIAQIHVSWLAPVKIRRTLIGGSRAMMVYDDLAPDTKLRIYDHGIAEFDRSGAQLDEPLQWRTGYRSGEMRAPLLTLAEPLHGLVEHFIACIVTGCPPRSGGGSGARVVAWLEAAQRSLALGGLPVDLGGAEEGPL
jgi:predicted dehydrogenase